MLRYPNMLHYANGIVSLKWRCGKDHALIARVSISIFIRYLLHYLQLLGPVMHGVFQPNHKMRGDILCLLRLYGECSVLIDQTTHTDETLERLEDVLNRMANLEEVINCFSVPGPADISQIVAKNIGFSLNTPKRHLMHHHLTESIRAKGPVCNTDTGAGEAQHRDTKVCYAHSNRQPGSFQLQVSYMCSG